MATFHESTAATGGGAKRPTVRQKVGHLRVDEQGEVSYKKTPSSTLMASLQLGLQHSIGGLEPKPRRDILMTDFDVIETVDFPSEGSTITQAHNYKDFTFTTYSPVAFRFFREAFHIPADDYLLALCHQSLRELSNPGASGSLFYLSADDEFIIKTVQKKEAKFLQKLLPGYYLNLTQNKKTLLPKFFGLYQYRCGGIKIRIVVMNNLLPSSLQYHWKFDLKGSTYKRRASPAELKKGSPTYKDLDFSNHLPEGLWLSPEKYDILNSTLIRDCQVLESFGIMDYSLLLGIYNIDEALRSGDPPPTPTDDIAPAFRLSGEGEGEELRDRSRTFVQSRIEARKNFSIMHPDTIATSDSDVHEAPLPNYPEGYVQARTKVGDRLLLYLGVIDILQSYRLKKRLEHSFKAIITDGDTVSVHNPSFYSQRFLTFMTDSIFKKERAKIRPRRNSTLAPSKGPRRQASEKMSTRPLSPNSSRQPPLYRQESGDIKYSPNRRIAHPTSPDHLPPPASSILDSTPTQSEILLRRKDQTPPSDKATPINGTTPIISPKLNAGGEESMIELGELEITLVKGEEEEERKDRINTSTPVNEIDQSSLIQTSVSVIVDGSSLQHNKGEEDKERESVLVASSPLPSLQHKDSL